METDVKPHTWFINGTEIQIWSPGGGRIVHDSKFKKITIYGYSNTFGQADHAKTKSYLAIEYPDFDISWNNDGY